MNRLEITGRAQLSSNGFTVNGKNMTTLLETVFGAVNEPDGSKDYGTLRFIIEEEY